MEKLKRFLGLLLAIFIVLQIVLGYLAKDVDNQFIVTTNLKGPNILTNEPVRMTLLNNKNEKIHGVTYVNGYMFPYIENDTYTLNVKMGKRDIQYPIDKVNKNCIKRITFPVESNHKDIILFINIFTGIILVLNLFIFYFYREKLMRKKELLVPFALLLLKILSTNTLVFTERMAVIINLGISLILNFYLLYYVLTKVKIKEKMVENVIKFISWGYIINAMLFFIIVHSSKVFIFIFKNTQIFQSPMLYFYKWIDGPFLILLIFLIQSLCERVKNPLYKAKTQREIIMLSLLIFSIWIQKYAYQHQIYFYLNLFEEVFLYWLIVAMTVSNSNRVSALFIRAFLSLLFVYIFLLYAKDIKVVTLFLVTVSIINLYTYMFENVLNINEKEFEPLINRLYLIDTEDRFRREIKKEIEKKVEYAHLRIVLFNKRDDYKKFVRDIDYPEDKIIMRREDILGDYSGGVRLKYNKNGFLGLILVKNTRDRLVFEEERYLLEMSKAVSVIASKIRMDYLKKELKECTK